MEEGDMRSPADVAAVVKAACIQAALEGYERASADGLCAEGALEVALEAIRMLDVAAVLRELEERGARSWKETAA
jgi:hypothetical protein